LATIDLISPIDQPEGKNRLLDEISNNLQDNSFDEFYVMVAFAKIGPLLKLYEKIIQWKKTKTISGIFGIDQQGTSIEALQFAVDHFDQISVLHIKGKFTPTFHPKIYLFKGKTSAIAYVGSNNLTVGGTETNFEAYIKVEMDLPDDQDFLDKIEVSWNRCIETAIKLDDKHLEKLINEKYVISEKDMWERGMVKEQSKKIAQKGQENIILEEDKNKISFPKFRVVPPSPIPKSALVAGKKKEKQKLEEREIQDVQLEQQPLEVHKDFHVTSLVIQIVPHHNGEVFLSKLAVNQNASFFGWPFSGQTVPKIAGNPAYPQREPDPVVNIKVYDEQGNLSIHHDRFGLNTVYYSKKSEIRITFPQDIVKLTQPYINGPYPIMVLCNLPIAERLDYDMDIYIPGNQPYSEFEVVCNQSMPSGGKALARRFGWL